MSASQRATGTSSPLTLSLSKGERLASAVARAWFDRLTMSEACRYSTGSDAIEAPLSNTGSTPSIWLYRTAAGVKPRLIATS